jgi:hypothetical protein
VKKSKNQPHGVSDDTLASYQQQCDAIGKDWQTLRGLIDAYPKAGAEKDRLEDELLSVKSRLSCDYTVLTHWRKGGYGLSAGINKMLSGATNLATLAETAGSPESRVNQTWREVQSSLKKINETIRGARSQLSRGKEAHLPEELLVHNTQRPFPIKKVLKTAGIVIAVVLALGTLYIMRNFLGFWAPGAGEGLVVDEAMSDEAKIQSVFYAMNEAFRRDDVDMFMTLIAKDFKDDDGNKKTALRVALQAYHEQGLFKTVTADWSRMELLDKDGYLYARPIYIRTAEDDLTIHLGFKNYGGKLLIATGSGT